MGWRINIIIVFLFISSLQAATIPNEYFIKYSGDPKNLRSPEVIESQHLFENYYWVKLLPGALLTQSQNLALISKNSKAAKRSLVVSRRPANDLAEERDPLDPRMKNQYSLQGPENGGMSVNALYDQSEEASRQEVIVAVVDTGVDVQHEDLREKMWINHGEIPGDSLDNDGNGYVDDVYGINTLTRDAQGRATSNVSDVHGHGTHVSGIIAAQRKNGVGIAGVSEKARIMAIRTVPGDGDETDRDVVESFIYAAKNGARVINCSFGKLTHEGGDIVREAIDYVGREYGVLVVAAAGNSSQDLEKVKAYPASYDNENFLVIAATDDKGERAYFSNYGKVSVDLAAPGVDVLSSTPNNRYEYFSGTSMASPNAAGVVAELLSLNPSLTGLEAKRLIMDTAHLKDDLDFWFVVKGLVNLFDAQTSL